MFQNKINLVIFGASFLVRLISHRWVSTCHWYRKITVGLNYRRNCRRGSNRCTKKRRQKKSRNWFFKNVDETWRLHHLAFCPKHSGDSLRENESFSWSVPSRFWRQNEEKARWHIWWNVGFVCMKHCFFVVWKTRITWFFICVYTKTNSGIRFAIT